MIFGLWEWFFSKYSMEKYPGTAPLNNSSKYKSSKIMFLSWKIYLKILKILSENVLQLIRIKECLFSNSRSIPLLREFVEMEFPNFKKNPPVEIKIAFKTWKVTNVSFVIYLPKMIQTRANPNKFIIAIMCLMLLAQKNNCIAK